MLALLVAIRDFLVAAALAWVGVSMEPQRAAEKACAGEACIDQENR